MSDGSGGPQWLGLLKWSLQYQDGTHASNAREMNKEDVAWLERVLTGKS